MVIEAVTKREAVAPPVSKAKGESIRRPHFDSIRALMFVAVYIGHVTTSHVSNFYGSGVVNSVSSFAFYAYLVLSGFLITRILIGSDTGRQWSDLRDFWSRRSMRIFPVYYLTLVMLLVCGQLPEPLPFFTYVSNVYLFVTNEMAGPACHLWSLAVEEQFYVLFPLALIIAGRKHRLGMIVFLLIACVVSHQAVIHFFPNHIVKLLLPSAGQCLLAGAVAGYLDMKLKQSDETRLFFVALLFNIALMALQSFDKSVVHTLILVNSCALAFLIYTLWRTRNQFVQKALSNKLMVHFGKTSYAMYLFHLPILYLLIDFPFEWKATIGFVLTAVLGTASWYLFESPINNLRNKLIPSRL